MRIAICVTCCDLLPRPAATFASPPPFLSPLRALHSRFLLSSAYHTRHDDRSPSPARHRLLAPLLGGQHLYRAERATITVPLRLAPHPRPHPHVLPVERDHPPQRRRRRAGQARALHFRDAVLPWVAPLARPHPHGLVLPVGAPPLSALSVSDARTGPLPGRVRHAHLLDTHHLAPPLPPRRRPPFVARPRRARVLLPRPARQARRLALLPLLTPLPARPSPATRNLRQRARLHRRALGARPRATSERALARANGRRRGGGLARARRVQRRRPGGVVGRLGRGDGCGEVLSVGEALWTLF